MIVVRVDIYHGIDRDRPKILKDIRRKLGYSCAEVFDITKEIAKSVEL